ncbi:hypothetical protein KC19_4G109200 [Ceratodon purpureus]|uniref:Uncharacterized protein n=1 Tax=Ceratodon purpureus TaxID=3225 RepID=A0A8T0IAR9_CERPU|nr:hypothetical protein KC19_4G109200 [Ceratodon purpureus]
MATGTPFVGIDYGRLGNPLPKPEEVVKLLQKQGVKNVKIYDVDHNVLNAFTNSGIKLSVSVPNDKVEALFSGGQGAADRWVQENIVPYKDTVTSIGVGNEWLHPSSRYKDSKALVPVMRLLQTSLSKHRLSEQIKVSTPHAYGGFVNPSFPPSSGRFQDEGKMREILQFLVDNHSYVMLNVYPFFAYAQEGSIDENYALFKTPSKAVQDGPLRYTNLFDAMLDTFISAMAKLDPRFKNLPIVVTETGWPNGGSTRRGVNVENARYYNQSVIKHVLAKKGTPLRPGQSFPTYIFALFDENQKDLVWDHEERHFGHFRVGANGKVEPVYQLRMAG